MHICSVISAFVEMDRDKDRLTDTNTTTTLFLARFFSEHAEVSKTLQGENKTVKGNGGFGTNQRRAIFYCERSF